MIQPRTEKTSLALLTDMYQLTMAFGYWKLKRHNTRAVFNLYFRDPPFNSGYTIAAGLEDALELLANFRFSNGDLEYLASIRDNNKEPIFSEAFIEYLRELRTSCDVHAVSEGTVVFPHEPLLRISGPILECQLFETALLNLINYQTLVATKAARVCYAAQGDPVLEFGLRRAHGIDGGLSASRAAYIGGCAATSNLLAGKTFGIPVQGTHAHSWVMCFDNELDAFLAYAETIPGNCVFLVDTYDTMKGIENAIKAGRKLREHGHELFGIRLDSGDLAYLSIEARRMLDEAGFTNTTIVASNDLDETIIDSLKQQGSKIGVWGVGTRLVTSYDQPALGGVYKLTAIQDSAGEWHPKLKLSEQAVKISTPGILQTRRFKDAKGFLADMVYNELQPPPDEPTMIDPLDPTRRRRLTPDLETEDLLKPVLREGQRVLDPKPLREIRDTTQSQLTLLHDGIKRFVNPHRYPVGLERQLYDMKTRLILAERGFAETDE